MSMRESTVKNHLKQVLDDEILSYGSLVPLSSAKLLEKIISTGVQRMSIQGALERPDKRLLAEQNLKRFIKSVARFAARNKKNIMGVRAVEMAIVDLSPLWPYM